MAWGNTNSNRGADIIEVLQPRGCDHTYRLFSVVPTPLKKVQFFYVLWVGTAVLLTNTFLIDWGRFCLYWMAEADRKAGVMTCNKGSAAEIELARCSGHVARLANGWITDSIKNGWCMCDVTHMSLWSSKSVANGIYCASDDDLKLQQFLFKTYMWHICYIILLLTGSASQKD